MSLGEVDLAAFMALVRSVFGVGVALRRLDEPLADLNQGPARRQELLRARL